MLDKSTTHWFLSLGTLKSYHSKYIYWNVVDVSSCLPACSSKQSSYLKEVVWTAMTFTVQLSIVANNEDTSHECIYIYVQLGKECSMQIYPLDGYMPTPTDKI